MNGDPHIHIPYASGNPFTDRGTTPKGSQQGGSGNVGAGTNSIVPHGKSVSVSGATAHERTPGNAVPQIEDSGTRSAVPVSGPPSATKCAVERPRLLPEVFVFPEGGGSPERPNSAGFVTKAGTVTAHLTELPVTPEEPCGGDIATSGVPSSGSATGLLGGSNSNLTATTPCGNNDLSGVKMRRKMLAQRHSTAGGGSGKSHKLPQDGA